MRRVRSPADVELDGINHQPGWQPLPREEFRSRVTDVVAGDGWVIDGNYAAVQDLVLARADTVVWLDLPRPLVMRRIVRRTHGTFEERYGEVADIRLRSPADVKKFLTEGL